MFIYLFIAFVMGLTRVFHPLCWFFPFAVLCTGLLSLEDNGLQETQTELVEQHLQQVCDNRSQHKHEGYSGTHTECGVNLLAHAEERADTQELAQDDVVNKDRRDKYQEIDHNFNLKFKIQNLKLLLLQFLYEGHDKRQSDEGTRSQYEDKHAVFVAEETTTKDTTRT